MKNRGTRMLIDYFISYKMWDEAEEIIMLFPKRREKTEYLVKLMNSYLKDRLFDDARRISRMLDDLDEDEEEE